MQHHQSPALAAEPVMLRQEARLPTPSSYPTAPQHTQEYPVPYSYQHQQHQQPHESSSSSSNLYHHHHHPYDAKKEAQQYHGVPMQVNVAIDQNLYSAPAADAWTPPPHNTTTTQRCAAPPPPVNGWTHQNSSHNTSTASLAFHPPSRRHSRVTAWQGPPAPSPMNNNPALNRVPQIYTHHHQQSAPDLYAQVAPPRSDSMGSVYTPAGGSSAHVSARPSPDPSQQYRYYLGNDDGMDRATGPQTFATSLLSTIDHYGNKIADALGLGGPAPTNGASAGYAQNNMHHQQQRGPAPPLSRAVVYGPYDPTALV
ncbi:hypothetical protein DFJ77DRAFT_39206 [Powellomyces hirtus]|nr:hypothetical protein DFJ77DRAFT_39206 [Powellomyces hirtus]